MSTNDHEGSKIPGPEVFRLAKAHSVQSLIPLLESGLGSRITWIKRETLGGSHAVYFAGLENGDECVVRIATHPEHDLAMEVWVVERCRAMGIPVPETLIYDPAPADTSPPFMVARRMPGVPAYALPLTPAERRAVFEQLGRFAAIIHCAALPGFGKLQAGSYGYCGCSTSLSEYVIDGVDYFLGRLPGGLIPQARKMAIRNRFIGERAILDRPAGALVHGDYRFKNILLDELCVSAVLDFEMAISGDPVMDIAWLHYSDGHDEQDLNAIFNGYRQAAAADLGAGVRKRLLLYKMRYALEHLWWVAEFQDETGVADVLNRLQELEQAFDVPDSD